MIKHGLIIILISLVFVSIKIEGADWIGTETFRNAFSSVGHGIVSECNFVFSYEDFFLKSIYALKASFNVVKSAVSTCLSKIFCLK